jgi:4-hydroxy-tetrahydrodipicolinate synthase
MNKLHGAYTALVTPFKADGTIDHAAWDALIRLQLDSGINGIVPIGTTGENPTLHDDEEGDLIAEAAALCKNKATLIVGTGSNSTAAAIRYTEQAAKFGADAALVVTPYYNRPSDEGVFQHFAAVAKVGLPVVVYNIAGRTGKNIATPLLDRIAGLPGVIAVKEASGSMTQIMEVIEQVVPAHPGFSVLSGDDALTLPLMAAGGDGIISVVSNAVPKAVVALAAACERGDFAAARVLHYRLLPLVRAAFIESNPAPIKYALEHLGLCTGALRLPLVKISAENAKIVDKAIDTFLAV